MNLASRTNMPPYLHTFICAQTKSTKIRQLSALILIASSFTLFGCSSVSSSDIQQDQANSKSIAPVISTKDNNIEALLKAEFTLQREGPNRAFVPIYKIAKKTRDKTLAEKLVRVAIASQNNENIEKSADLLLSISPENEQAHALKIQMKIQSHDADNAAKLIEFAIEHKISLQFLPLYIDKNIRNTDLINTVESTLSQLSASDNTNLFIKASHARTQFSAGEFQSAIKTSQALLSNRDTMDTEPLFLILAYSQDQLDNTKSAITTIEKGRLQFPHSIRLLAPLLEFLVKSKQTDTAIQRYQDAELDTPSRLQIGITFGNLLLSSGHPDVALTILNQLPKEQYGFENQASYLKATALSDLGQKQHAIIEMKKVSGVLNAHATNQIALWLYDEEKEQEINDMVLMRTSKSHISEVVSTICLLHEEHKQHGLSSELLHKTLQLYPESKALRYRKALLDDAIGNWKSTVTELNILLADAPLNPQYLNALGYTLLTRSNDIDKAMSYIEKAYSQNDKDPAIIDSLGWGYFLQGKLIKASFYLKKAWNTLQDAEIAAHYGEVLWQQNAHQEANRIWQEALNNTPQNALLIETVTRLNPSLLDNY